MGGMRGMRHGRDEEHERDQPAMGGMRGRRHGRDEAWER